MISCESSEELMSTYIDGESDDAGNTELFRHLGACLSCRKTFAELGALRTRIAAIPEPSVPTHLDRRIARLNATRPAQVSHLATRLRSLWESRLTVPAPALALTLLLATVTLFISLLYIRTAQPPAGEQQVMYIMSMPAIEVHGAPGHTSSHAQ